MIEPVVIPELLWGKDDGESSTDLYKIPFHSIGAGTAKKRSLRIKRAAASCASIDVAIQRSPTKYEMAKAAYPLALIWSDSNNASDNAASPLSFARRRRYGNADRELLLTDICDIATGRKTFAFQSFVTKRAKGEIPPESCCFSVIGKTRTLDFYVNDPGTASRWKGLEEAGFGRRRVLVMDYLDGVPLSRAAEEMLKKGIEPNSPESQLFGRRLLKSLTEVFGRCILETGFFHAVSRSKY